MKTKGIIYRMRNKDDENASGEIYIGSTVETLRGRLNKHKKDWQEGSSIRSVALFNLYGCDNVIIEEIDSIYIDYPSEKKKLRDLEGLHIRNNINQCVNKNIPSRTIEEYRQAVEYPYRREHIYCCCGAHIVRRYKEPHKKSEKHKKFISNNTIV